MTELRKKWLEVVDKWKCRECEGIGATQEHSSKCDGSRCATDCPVVERCDSCMGTGLIGTYTYLALRDVVAPELQSLADKERREACDFGTLYSDVEGMKKLMAGELSQDEAVQHAKDRAWADYLNSLREDK